MGQILTLELESRTAAIRELLGNAVREYRRVVYANSLGAEAMVLTDIICTEVPEIDIISIDTGRLHEETYELLEKLQRRYDNRIRVIYPDGARTWRAADAREVPIVQRVVWQLVHADVAPYLLLAPVEQRTYLV